MKKKIISSILVFVIAISSLFINVFADSATRLQEIDLNVNIGEYDNVVGGSIMISYSPEVCTSVSGTWNISDTSVKSFKTSNNQGVFMMTSASRVSGNIFSIKTKVNADAEYNTDFTVSATVILTLADKTNITVPVTVSKITIICSHENLSDLFQRSSEQHWKICEDCNEKTQIGNHEYDNACDTTCNVCGYERSITHSYQQTWNTDGTNHWHECSVCHDKTDIGTHSGGTATCKELSVCEKCNTAYGNYAGHNYVEVVDAKYLKSVATCKDLAVYYKSCSVCGEKGVETFTIGTVDNTNHSGGTYLVGQKAASCYEKGYTGDIYCSDCDTKLKSGQAISKTSHNSASAWSNNATCHWKECAVAACGVVIEDTKELHTFEWKVDKAATEDEIGSKHEECKVCGYKRNEGTLIDKLDHTHTIVHHDSVPGSCKTEGNIEYWTCSSEKCAGKYYSEQTCTLTVESIIVPVDENNHDHTEIRDKKDATCTEDGYTGDTYCTDCGKKTKDGEAIKASGHKYKNGKCKVCGKNDPNYTPASPKTVESGYMTLLSILASVLLFAVLALIFTKKKK